ncbi:signal peptidase 22 kDa subunit [Xylaria nigripes]|nr:signal peptidase 22 kDa subunit [Xylaria nigripes]
MYNSLTRIQNVFGLFTTVAFIVGAIIAASDLTAPRTPSATIKPTDVQVVKGRPHYYSSKKEEYGIIKFSLDADLSSLFTWNTKQLFVYVTAEWPASPLGHDDGMNQTNKAVIWDTIITSPSSDHLANIGPATLKKLRKSAAGKSIDPSRYEDPSIPAVRGTETDKKDTIHRGKLSLKNQRPKYQITHPAGKVAKTEDVTLHVHYNVQPWVGILTWNQDVDFGLWKRMAQGVSKAFGLPALKKDDKKGK